MSPREVPLPPPRVARRWAVATPVGDARVHVVEPHRGRPARSTVVLGHGAGGGVEARDLVALADVLPAHGHRVVLVEQPWRVAGRRVAAPPASLDAAWLAVVDALRADEAGVEGPLVVGGRSAGARVACRTAAAVGAEAVVALAFPLHPPGRPGAGRSAELAAAGVPLLVVQGERDPFGSAQEVRAVARRVRPPVRVVGVPAADHSLAVPASAPCTPREALQLVAESVLRALSEWAPARRR